MCPVPNHSWPSSEISQFFIFTDISPRNCMSLVSRKSQSVRHLFIPYVHPWCRREELGFISQFFCFQSSHTDHSRSIFQLPYNSCYERLLPPYFEKIPYVCRQFKYRVLPNFLSILHWSMLKAQCTYSFVDVYISMDYKLDLMAISFFLFGDFTARRGWWAP